jgi:ElaB/YqjD/DUF883 family membrane-anchored ribosome-binding protein
MSDMNNNSPIEGVLEELEEILEEIEDNLKYSAKKSDQEYREKLFERADFLKEYCEKYLGNERKNIIKIAIGNNVLKEKLDFTDEEIEKALEDKEVSDYILKNNPIYFRKFRPIYKSILKHKINETKK